MNYFGHCLSYLHCVQFAETKFRLLKKNPNKQKAHIKKKKHKTKTEQQTPWISQTYLDVQLRET